MQESNTNIVVERVVSRATPRAHEKQEAKKGRRQDKAEARQRKAKELAEVKRQADIAEEKRRAAEEAKRREAKQAQQVKQSPANKPATIQKILQPKLKVIQKSTPVQTR